MIGKSKSITHGSNDLRYITGESENKKHPEKIFHVMNNIMPDYFDSSGIWLNMKEKLSAYKPLKNSLIRMELSPPVEHTKGYTIDDWRKLWDEFIAEYDRQEIMDGNGRIISSKTNLANTRGTVWAHYESKGGIPHLHAAYCRIDENSHMNNDHQSHLRTQRAAEAVARKHGWTTAANIRKIHIIEASDDCTEILKNMDAWSWDSYISALKHKGYSFRDRHDSMGNITGYVIQKGHSRYKASELGIGRNLMASKIENTWKKYHEGQPAKQKHSPNEPAYTKPQKYIYKPENYYKSYKPNTEVYEFMHMDEEKRYFLPEIAHDVLNAEIDYHEIVNWKEMQDMAVKIFLQLLIPQEVSVSDGGGGSQSNLPWRDKDEDDEHWMRRCAHAVSRFVKKLPRYKLHR